MKTWRILLSEWYRNVLGSGMGAAFIHEKGVTWKNFKHQTFPEFSYEWLEAELDTGMIPQIWTAKKLLLIFMTNR